MVVFNARLKMRFAFLLLISSTFAFASNAKAEVLFEGYSKVLLSGAHVGYAVQRYEFDSKKQEFTTTSYLRTNQVGGNITESFKARSTAGLKPISYQYTGLSGGTGKTIDATFKNDEMTAMVRENGKVQTIKKKIPKNAFLSSFLAYLMLQGKEGIKPGARYGYQALAEEDANLYTGEAVIEKEEIISGITTFKVLNTFKGTRFVSNVTHKGEVIATRSPVQQVSTELVANMQDATAGMQFNSNSMNVLFGAIPKGSENAVSRKAGSTTGSTTGSTITSDSKTPSVKGTTASPVTADKAVLGAAEDEAATAATTSGTAGAKKQQVLNATPAPTSDNPKTDGVPAGQGIIIKGAPTAGEAADKKSENKK